MLVSSFGSTTRAPTFTMSCFWRHSLCLCLGATLAALPSRAAEPESSVDPIVFELVTDNGIDFVTNPGRTDHRHQPETMVAGVALFDYDNDGFLDVYVVNGAKMTELDKTDPSFWNRLYHNEGDGTFEDVTEKAGVKGRGYDLGVAAGDYDADGFTDLFVAGLRENLLFRNKGDGTFEDVADQAGFNKPDPEYGTLWAVAAGFVDYDNDGDLDLFVSNYCVWDPETEPLCGPRGLNDYCHPNNYRGLPNSLYRNDGDGNFAALDAGLKGLLFASADWGDYDADGDLDILLSGARLTPFIMEGEIKIYRNDSGSFTDISDGIVGSFENEQTLGRYQGAVAWGDFNNDGRLDFFVTGAKDPQSPERGQVYSALPNDQFLKVQNDRFDGGLFGSAGITLYVL